MTNEYFTRKDAFLNLAVKIPAVFRPDWMTIPSSLEKLAGISQMEAYVASLLGCNNDASEASRILYCLANNNLVIDDLFSSELLVKLYENMVSENTSFSDEEIYITKSKLRPLFSHAIISDDILITLIALEYKFNIGLIDGLYHAAKDIKVDIVKNDSLANRTEWNEFCTFKDYVVEHNNIEPHLQEELLVFIGVLSQLDKTKLTNSNFKSMTLDYFELISVIAKQNADSIGELDEAKVVAMWHKTNSLLPMVFHKLLCWIDYKFDTNIIKVLIDKVQGTHMQSILAKHLTYAKDDPKRLRFSDNPHGKFCEWVMTSYDEPADKIMAMSAFDAFMTRNIKDYKGFFDTYSYVFNSIFLTKEFNGLHYTTLGFNKAFDKDDLGVVSEYIGNDYVAHLHTLDVAFGFSFCGILYRHITGLTSHQLTSVNDDTLAPLGYKAGVVERLHELGISDTGVSYSLMVLLDSDNTKWDNVSDYFNNNVDAVDKLSSIDWGLNGSELDEIMTIMFDSSAIKMVGLTSEAFVKLLLTLEVKFGIEYYSSAKELMKPTHDKDLDAVLTTVYKEELVFTPGKHKNLPALASKPKFDVTKLDTAIVSSIKTTMASFDEAISMEPDTLGNPIVLAKEDSSIDYNSPKGFNDDFEGDSISYTLKDGELSLGIDDTFSTRVAKLAMDLSINKSIPVSLYECSCRVVDNALVATISLDAGDSNIELFKSLNNAKERLGNDAFAYRPYSTDISLTYKKDITLVTVAITVPTPYSSLSTNKLVGTIRNVLIDNVDENLTLTKFLIRFPKDSVDTKPIPVAYYVAETDKMGIGTINLVSTLANHTYYACTADLPKEKGIVVLPDYFNPKDVIVLKDNNEFELPIFVKFPEK